MFYTYERTLPLVEDWLQQVVLNLFEFGEGCFPWFIYCDNDHYAEMLSSALKQHPIYCECILEKTDFNTKKLIVRLLEEGKLQALISHFDFLKNITFDMTKVITASLSFKQKGECYYTITVHESNHWYEVLGVTYSSKQKPNVTVPIWDHKKQEEVPKVITYPTTLVVKYTLNDERVVSEYVPLEDRHQQYFDVKGWLNKRFINYSFDKIPLSEIKVADILSKRVVLKNPKKVATASINGYEKIIDYKF